MKGLVSRVRGLTRDNKLASQEARELLPLWRENYRYASELAEKNFLRLVFFAFLFALIATAQVSDVTAFGVKINGVSIPLAISLFLSAYYYYRFVGLLCFAQNIEEVIREVYYQQFQSWQTASLIDLTDYPAISQIENTYAGLSEEGPKVFRIINWGGVTVAFLALCVVPVVFFCWAGYSLISGSVLSKNLAIAISVAVAAIVMRSVLLLVQSIILSQGE